MEAMIENALRELIISEKNNFDFYRQAAEMVSDNKTKQVFEHLAGEEIGYLHVFTTIYLGSGYGNDIKKLTKLPPDHTYPPYSALIREGTTNGCEQRALELSLQQILACMKRYTRLAADLSNPRLSMLFGRALRKTYTYYGIIHREYMRVIRLFDRQNEFSYGYR